MVRTLALLVIGALAGIALGHELLRWRVAQAPVVPPDAASMFPARSADALVERVRRLAAGRIRADPDGARELALAQPEGPVRDAALSMLVRRGLFGNATFDAEVVGAFASTSARHQALLPVLPRILKADPARGRALLDDHVTEPVLRETILAQAESALY